MNYTTFRCRLCGILALLCIIITNSMYAQTTLSSLQNTPFLSSTDYQILMQEGVSEFSPYATTGYLLDASYTNVDLLKLSRDIVTDSTAIDNDMFGAIYSTLMMAATTSSPLPDPDTFYMDKALKQEFPRGILSLTAMTYRYNYIRRDAISAGLASWSGKKLMPLVSAATLLRTDTLLAVTPQRNYVDTASVIFHVDQLASNWSVPPSVIEIDAGEGWGFVPVPVGKGLLIVFNTGGLKTIRIRANRGNGTYIYSHFDLDVRISGSSFTDPLTLRDRIEYDNENPIKVRLEATEAYLGETASARLYIFTHCDDNIIRKPIILVDGFDPEFLGNSNTYRQMFQENRLGLVNQPYSPKTVHQTLFDEGYDVIFVDWADQVVAAPSPFSFFTIVTDENNEPLLDENGMMQTTPEATINQIVNWTVRRGGQDYPQRNAYVFEEVLKYVNDQKHNYGHSSEPTQVVALSMGGVVARWALLDMEERGMPHEVEHFFAWDSPHRGANIPIGLQAAIKDLGEFKIHHPWHPAGLKLSDMLPVLNQKKNIITSPFAQSAMLAQAYDDGSFTKFHTFMNQLQTKGSTANGDLHLCKFSAIPSGAIDGTIQNFAAGDRIAHINQNLGTTLEEKWSGDHKVAIERWADGFLNIFGVSISTFFKLEGEIFSLKNSGRTDVFKRNFRGAILGVPLEKSEVIYFMENSVPLDNLAGGFTQLGGDVSTIGFDVRSYAFVPTFSSLDVKTALPFTYINYNFSNVSTVLGSGLVRPKSYMSDLATPIESFIVKRSGAFETFPTQKNKFHTFNYRHATTFFFYDLLDNTGNVETSQMGVLDNKEYNYGLNQAILPLYGVGQFVPRSTPNNLTSSLRVINNGKLRVNNGGDIGLRPASPAAPNATGNNFVLNIQKEGCTQETVILDIESKAQMLIGDHSVTNSGRVNVTSGNWIRIHDGGELKLEEKSELNVYSGGILQLKTGSVTTLSQGSRIVMHPGSVLSIETGAIVNIGSNSYVSVYGAIHSTGTPLWNCDNGYLFLGKGSTLDFAGGLKMIGTNKNNLMLKLDENTPLEMTGKSLDLSGGMVRGTDATGLSLFYLFNLKNMTRVNFSNLKFSPYTTNGTNGVFIENSDYTVIDGCYFEKFLTALFINQLTKQNLTPTLSNSTFMDNSIGIDLNNITTVNPYKIIINSTAPNSLAIYNRGDIGLKCYNVGTANVKESWIAKVGSGISFDGGSLNLICTNLTYNSTGVISYFATTVKFQQSALIRNLVGVSGIINAFQISTLVNSSILHNIFIACDASYQFDLPNEYETIISAPQFGPGTPYSGCGKLFRFSLGSSLTSIDGRGNFWGNSTDLSGIASKIVITNNSLANVTVVTSAAITSPRDPQYCNIGSQLVKEDTGIFESNSSKDMLDFAIYPNPTNGNITVSMSGGGEQGSLQIFNNIGQMVYKGNVIDGQNVDLTLLPSGIYNYKIVTPKAINGGVKKIVILR